MRYFSKEKRRAGVGDNDGRVRVATVVLGRLLHVLERLQSNKYKEMNE